jgi:hypothetical protein
MSELATTIEEAVRAVPGVVSMFSVGPATLVAISGTNPVRIAVSVGVDRSMQAPATAAEIAAVIRSIAPVGADISVRISRVVS